LSVDEMRFLDNWEPSLQDLEEQILKEQEEEESSSSRLGSKLNSPTANTVQSTALNTARSDAVSRISSLRPKSGTSIKLPGLLKSSSTTSESFHRSKTPHLLKLKTMRSTACLRNDILANLRKETQNLRDEVQLSKGTASMQEGTLGPAPGKKKRPVSPFKSTQRLRFVSRPVSPVDQKFEPGPEEIARTQRRSVRVLGNLM
jgi:hypothetical protein